MKEKSSALLAGQVSGPGGPSLPSVESSSALERSTLVLRCSLDESCGSAAEAVSVWEDREDRRLLGGCFHAVVLLSGDGDSGATLQGRERAENFQYRRWQQTQPQACSLCQPASDGPSIPVRQPLWKSHTTCQPGEGTPGQVQSGWGQCCATADPLPPGCPIQGAPGPLCLDPAPLPSQAH